MTNHVVRLYTLACAVLLLFVSWAAIAARPWAADDNAKADPRWAALAAREKRLRQDAVYVGRTVAKRWRIYRARRAARAVVPAAPSVRVVNLPPVTATRTS
jgi:hypothetical protein